MRRVKVRKARRARGVDESGEDNGDEEMDAVSDRGSRQGNPSS